MTVPRRRKSWFGLLGLSTNLTGDATVLGGGLTATEAGNTVLRIMGEYTISPTSAPVVSDLATVTVGIAIVSADAFELGLTVVPDPGSEPEYDWLYWRAHSMAFDNVLSDSSGANATLRRPFDVKSMRKLGARETLCSIVQYSDISGSSPLSYEFSQARVLMALP